MTQAEAENSPVVFQALIAPYRSLTPRGVAVLVSVLMVLVGLVVLRFALMGAWPVVLFSVFEVPLVIVLLALNIRRARASELIMVNAQCVTVLRTDPHGRSSEVSLPVAWLNIHYSDDDPRLLLQNRGLEQEIGAFLHETEKRSLCEALSAALHELRNPRFDNPQLRDGL